MFKSVDIDIGVSIEVTILNGVTKYYAVPYIPGGITLRLDVSDGEVACYISDTTRNPGPDDNVWIINKRGYADRFIEPEQFNRTGTRHIYIALTGTGPLNNTCFLNTTAGNFSSQGSHK